MVKAKVVKNPFKKPSSTHISKISPANKVTKLSKVAPGKSKADGSKLKRNKKFIKKKEKEDRGVVFLSHIPHGFYEEQIEKYFSQFGHVTRVNLPRNKFGKSKGYAFIEFRHPEVAEVAAETMNNYLMMNRLLKAKYIPPGEQKPWGFDVANKNKINHTTEKDKLELNVRKNRVLKNRKLSLEREAKLGVRLLKRAKAMHEKMLRLGVDYEFEVNRENLSTVFERRKQLLEKKKSKSEESDGNIKLGKKRELNDSENSLSSSSKKLRLTKHKSDENNELLKNEKSVSENQTPKIKNKLLHAESTPETKSQEDTQITKSAGKNTSSIKKKHDKKTLLKELLVNTSIIANKEMKTEETPKRKKGNKLLSTSLPVKGLKNKEKSKSEKFNEIESVKKKSRASIGIIPQNEKADKSKTKKPSDLKIPLNFSSNKKTKNVGKLTPKPKSSPGKKKSLNFNEIQSVKVSPKSLKTYNISSEAISATKKVKPSKTT